MRILVIGSGGREHALVKGLAGNEVHVAPGNAGMDGLAQRHPVEVGSPESIVSLAREIGVELVVIGPEVPLVAGATDALREEGIPVFGPSRAAAALEGSKAFAKEIMAAAGVRTASSTSVRTAEEIDAALDQYGPAFVVKDDGLAGGKGVVVTRDRSEAEAHARAVIAAGNPVLFESFLEGPEVSLFCLVDGATVVPLLPAQDHKRAYDDDAGPNTGGMGAYTPLPWLPEGAVERMVEEIVEPVAREMVARGIPYQGLLYLGAAWGPEGPAVVEFNARFGDPETQPVLSLLASPLVDALSAVASGTLSQLPPLKWEEGYAATVVIAAEGYPTAPRTGDAIAGENLADPNRVLHAGTDTKDGVLVSSGGRVLNVLGKGATLAEATANAYAEAEKITLQGSFYRRDIARKAIEGLIQPVR
ncbi:Phosphoribosylamine--glycine ligase [Corynebacterium capitovis DSM 44611]|uniref:phosphoribosylamine--glycine ligase n=1 Tax=Corynebacterium capitovis TaxID=131081 RepID=UPI00037C472B|nr:phosphoribosylamine--glycine ligase [Corynebacterium capitovis]WKD58120.1 Phosphoribosylamine--glycine ligase [Corynebacterium capitovis DSM 44611]